MRLNLKTFLFLIFVSWMLAPAAFTASFAGARDDTQLYEAAVACRQKLATSFAFSRSEANWLQCINEFKLVYIQHADTRLIDNVLLDLGDLYLGLHAKTQKNRYLRSALNSFRELYYYYPESRLAAQATLKAGDIYFKHLKQYRQAHGSYTRLLKYYGPSDPARKARQRLKELARYYVPPEFGYRSKASLVMVKDIRHWTNPRYTRVVLNLDRRVPYKNYVLKNPDRLFIDLYGARIAGKLTARPIIINDGLLKRARAAQNKPTTVRVVLDIDRIDSYKIFALDNPFRVIIDVSGAGKRKSHTFATGGVKSKQYGGGEKMTLARQLGLGIETVVIDPGHGGKDPGGIGPGGLMEKDVVLDISKRLKKFIEEGTGRRAYLTRYTDVFLPLEERTAIANTLEADLFVSIHVNANSVRAARGVETYYLNLATTPEEQETAARENQTSYKKISDLQGILNDIMLNSKIDESRVLARHIQSSLARGLKGYYRTRDLGVKKAPFYVLIGAQMPSVLVEVSFITNPKEEKLLASRKYRQSVARQIYHGLETYIEQMKATPDMASR